LESCKGVTILEKLGPIIEPEGGNWQNWRTIIFRLTIRLATGEILEVLDCFERRRKNQVSRTFRYHAMDVNNQCLFRFDTEGEAIPLDEPCHIHIGPNQHRLDDDDARLRGFSLSGRTFLDAFSLLHQHLKGRGMPWE